MRPRALAITLFSIAALGLGACGSDDELASSNPPNKPELTAPASANDLGSTQEQESTATADADQTTTEQQQTTPATPAPSTGGGTTAPQTTTPEGGGTGGQEAPQANSGSATQQFEDFCRQNPGAC